MFCRASFRKTGSHFSGSTLADENFPGGAVLGLKVAGHDVAWIRTDDPGAADIRILERATRELRVVLTFDKDFGELAFRCGLGSACGVIFFRLPMAPPAPSIARIVSVVQSRNDWAGHYSVVEPHRIRMRPIL
jgi:predicted nuclease of predicted toxin-antitoxin system